MELLSPNQMADTVLLGDDEDVCFASAVSLLLYSSSATQVVKLLMKQAA